MMMQGAQGLSNTTGSNDQGWTLHNPMNTREGLRLEPEQKGTNEGDEDTSGVHAFTSEFRRKEFLPHSSSATYFRQSNDSPIAPQIDAPQRLGPPQGAQVPSRTDKNANPSIDSQFGYGAARAIRDGKTSTVSSKISGNRSERNVQRRQKNNNSITNQLKDYAVLASAMKRAGRVQQQALALYCQGVLYDNLGQYEKAIEAYKEYQQLSHNMNDRAGEEIAMNCIGVGCYHLGDMVKAVHYHELHFQFCSDDTSKFVALSNLGLCESRAGNFLNARNYHQEALRLAISLGSPTGQSIAVGNLALAHLNDDFDSARLCMDKHLHLVRDLQNFHAEAFACLKLGEIAVHQNDFESALGYYEEARNIARRTGQKGIYKVANCCLGSTQGKLRFNQYLQNMKN